MINDVNEVICLGIVFCINLKACICKKLRITQYKNHFKINFIRLITEYTSVYVDVHVAKQMKIRFQKQSNILLSFVYVP